MLISSIHHQINSSQIHDPDCGCPCHTFPSGESKRQVVLRDGRHLVGVMRSYDQFSNIVLEDTHERHFVGGELKLIASTQSLSAVSRQG